MPCRSLILTLALLSPLAALAQDREALLKEIEQLRGEQKTQQENFEKRIKALEDRLTKKAPNEIVSGNGPIKISGYGQYRFDTDSDGPDTFYMRRLEMKMVGTAGPRTTWTIMVDPAKSLKLANNNTAVDQTTNILQDVFVTYDLGQGLTLDLGQRKIPFSWEGLVLPQLMDSPDRALFVERAGWGGVRDMGAQLAYKAKIYDVTASMTNGVGESQNQKDANDQKAFGIRGVLRPGPKGLHVGASAISERAANDTVRERYGAEAQWVSKEWTLRSEVATGLTDNVRGLGWYGHVGYRVSPKVELVGRYDFYDPDRTVMNDQERDVRGGVNYYMNGNNSKIQLHYVHREFKNGQAVKNQLQVNFVFGW